jgi:hypothetical protein
VQQLIGVDEGEIADEHCRALAEAAAFAGPAVLAVQGFVARVCGRRAASGWRVVHHVVVEQRERVHQFERRACPHHHLVVGMAAGADEAPVAEGRTQPLAAGQHQPGDLADRLAEIVVERRPAGLLGVEQRAQALIGPGRDVGQRGGRRRKRHIRRLGAISASLCDRGSAIRRRHVPKKH